MSSFTWLDYEGAARERALDAIDLFRERDTRDELGLASIRDAFSDLFFPGTNAVQTRARYFLIVPWVYRRLEAQRISAHEVEDKARRDEIRLIEVLLASEDSEGTIGKRAGATLKRLPSSIYWQGLIKLGILHFDGSRELYHRSIERFHPRGRERGDLDVADRRVSWHSSLPAPPEDFPRACSLALTRAEASYLEERLLASFSDSLCAHLLRSDEDADVEFVWEHPSTGGFPPNLRGALEHARLFSLTMHGAALLYNLILAELQQNEDRVEEYRAQLEQWGDGIANSETVIHSWDLSRFWQEVNQAKGRVGSPTRTFVTTWIEIVRAYAARTPHRKDARDLVSARERALKGPLARVNKGRPLETWEGASGARRLDYRWSAMGKQFVRDIQQARG